MFVVNLIQYYVHASAYLFVKYIIALKTHLGSWDEYPGS